MHTHDDSPLRVVLDPRPGDVGDTPEEFLARLGGPTEIRLTGRDSSRCRAVSTLVHGNEPSGLIAVQRLLGAGLQPAVDTRIFVLAVDAALAPPGFVQRMPPGRRDLNRCFFPPFSGPDGVLAGAVLASLHSRPHEALVDLHNNTGHNPAYGIVNRLGVEHLRLVTLFTDSCCILSDLCVGALTEAVVDRIPCAALELGHAADPAAHDLAQAGLERFLTTADLALRRDLEQPVALFDHPIRVRLRPGMTVSFGHAGGADADLTLRDDIENHNFQPVPRGTVLGWIRAGASWPVEARGADDREVSHEHFAVAEHALIHDSDFVPIMMTTNRAVAVQDCLYYLMRRRQVHELMPSPAAGDAG